MPARRLAACLTIACWLASPAQAGAEDLPVAVVEYAAGTAERVADGVDVGHTAPELAGTAVPASEPEVGVDGEGGVAPVQGQAGAALPDAGSSADPREEPTEPTPPPGPPSAQPSGEPTAEPSGEPTVRPSGEPTAQPTGRPPAQPPAPPVPDVPDESAAPDEQAAVDETAALVATPPEADAPAPAHPPEPAAPVLATGAPPAQIDEPEAESPPVRELGAPEGPAYDAPIFVPPAPPATRPSAPRGTPGPAYASTTAPKVRESAPKPNRRASRAPGTGRHPAPAIPHRRGTHGAASAGASAGGTTSPNVAALPGVAVLAVQGPVTRLRFSRPSWRLVSVAEPPERPG